MRKLKKFNFSCIHDTRISRGFPGFFHSGFLQLARMGKWWWGGWIRSYHSCYEGKSNGKEMDNFLYFSIILGAFLGAVFVAWRKEHRALKALQEKLKSSELEGEILGIYNVEVNGQDTLILVEVYIVNKSGLPSAVLDWSMTIETGSRTLTGEVLPLSGNNILVCVPGGKFTFPYVSYAPNKMTQPIPAGGMSSGWFWSTFRGICRRDLYEDKTMIVVSFSDVISGKRRRLRKFLDPESRIPGQFTQIKEST